MSSTIARLLNVPCTVLTPGTAVDQYGDVITSDAAGSSVTTKCYPSTGAANEATTNGPIASAEWTVYLPAGTPCTASSVVLLDGGTRRLEATQPPRLMLDARTGLVDHIELACKVVT